MIRYHFLIGETDDTMRRRYNDMRYFAKGVELPIRTAYANDVEEVIRLARNHTLQQLRHHYAPNRLIIPTQTYDEYEKASYLRNRCERFPNDPAANLLLYEFDMDTTLKIYLHNTLVEKKLKVYDVADMLKDLRIERLQILRAFDFKIDRTRVGDRVRQEALKRLGKTIRLDVVVQ